MKLINKQGKLINATEKAYKLIYKSKGFKEYKEGNQEQALTNTEIKKLLDDKGISYTTRDTKADLLKKLEGD